MKIEDDITKIVLAEGGTKMKVGKFPTWLNKLKMEGFRMELGRLRTFWVKDEQMVFGEPPSQSWQRVFEMCNSSSSSEVKQEEVPQQNEVTETSTVPEKSTKISDEFIPGIVPDTMTMPVLEKLKKMSTFERILMFQNTPQDRIEERKGRGGKMLKYVKGNFMDQEANIAFLFAMSSKIDGWHLGQDGVACYGSVSFRIDSGEYVISSGVGIDVQEYSGSDRKPVFTIAEMMKNAHTDMKKKALAAKGFNGDVYRGEI